MLSGKWTLGFPGFTLGDVSSSSIPARTHARHRSNSAGSARHSPYVARQHTYPFIHRAHSGSPPPTATLAPIGRPDYPAPLPAFHKANSHAPFPAALPAPPTTKPHELYHRYPPDSQPASPVDPEHRKALLAQPIQAAPHVGALQAAPHVGAFHSMPVVGVFQGTAPPPAELPISVWQAHPLVRTRARITREQLRALEALFAKTWFPTSQQRAEAANATGMREYSVTVWFQNRRSKAKKEGMSPPEGDRAKLRKDKGPKRDLGTHVFEIGSSRHPEPMAPYAPAPSGSAHPPAEQNLVWLEDARSRGRAPVMKTGGSHSPRIPDNAPERSRSPPSRSWSGAEHESDPEIESESESRPQDEPRHAYTQYSRESQLYPPRPVHPSYAQDAPTIRRQSSSCSTHSAVPRRRNSGHSPPESEGDAPEAEADSEDRPAKRSRRENEHAPEEERSDPE